VFLAYINGEKGRVEHIIDLLNRADSGAIKIFTSTISIAEVAFGRAEQTGKALDPSIEAQIDALWAVESPITLVDFHVLIAKDARDLARDAIPKGWSLKAYDAVHLATAGRLAVDELHTYDDKWAKYGQDVAVIIQEPVSSTPRLGL